MIDWSYVYSNDVIEKFESRHDCTIERAAAQGSAETLSQLRAGRADYDLVPLGNYAVTPAMEEGYLQPLDLDRIPAYGEIFDFLKKDYFEQNGEVYGVPRSFGQTPLAVNTDLVDREVTALADLWDPELEGLTGGRDDARLQVLYRNAAVGAPLNPTSAAEIDREALRADLVERLELTGGLWNSGGASEQLLRNEQVGVQPVWNYVIQAMQSEGLPVERVFPEEGTKAWFIQFTVRDGADNPDLAHTFIQEWFTEMGYQSLMKPSNIAVPSRQVFDEQNVDPATFGVDDPDQFIYEDPKPQSLIQTYSRTWSEAKTEADL
jgi:spermidine/putrescine transport system substrate-binding protein